MKHNGNLKFIILNLFSTNPEETNLFDKLVIPSQQLQKSIPNLGGS